MIRILIADDHQMVREGFARIVERHSDMKVLAEADTVDDLMGSVAETPADVIVLDISMPGPGFLPTMDRLRSEYPDTRVLVVSMHSEEEWAVRALEAGAHGYLSKSCSGEELIEGIRRLHAGAQYVSPHMAAGLARRLGPGGAGPGHESLSRREYEVLCLLGEGKRTKAVARQLGISPKTVSTYRARVLEKLGLENNADLVRYVVEHGLTL